MRKKDALFNVRTAVCLAIATALFSTVLRAQILTGTISGEITDARGAKIPGVSVAATNLDTSIVYRTQGNEAGSMFSPCSPPADIN
jgi:hypothetical protein